MIQSFLLSRKALSNAVTEGVCVLELRPQEKKTSQELKKLVNKIDGK